MVNWFKNRKGERIPGISRGGAEQVQWLVSRHNPQEEARRIAEDLGPGGVRVLLGWGLGYLAKELATSSKLVIVLEPEEVGQEVLGDQNIFPLKPHPTVEVYFFRPEHFGYELPTLLRTYTYSLLDTPVQSISLPGYRSAYPEAAELLRKEIDSFYTQVGPDLGVQTRFGNRWLFNSLINLPSWPSVFEKTEKHSQQIVVLGAGPSLSEGLETLRKTSQDPRVLAADTAYPLLREESFKHIPKVFVSIDAQWYSNLHLLGRVPNPDSKDLWVVDGTIDPGLRRRLPWTLPLFGNHPINTVFQKAGLPRELRFPGFTTAGLGALSLGCFLSPSNQVYGLDRGYPGFRSYAGGTYLDDWLGLGISRTRSRDTRDFEIMSRGNPSKITVTSQGYGHIDYLHSPFVENDIKYPLELEREIVVNWKAIFGKTVDRLIAAWTKDLNGFELLHRDPENSSLVPGALHRYKRLDGKEGLKESFENNRIMMVQWLKDFARGTG